MKIVAGEGKKERGPAQRGVKHKIPIEKIQKSKKKFKVENEGNEKNPIFFQKKKKNKMQIPPRKK